MATDQPESYRISFEVGLEQVVDYLRAVQRQLNLIGVVFGMAFGAVGVAIILTTDQWPTGLVAIGGGLLTALAAQTRYFDRWRARRQVRSLLGTRATFLIDDSGVFAETVTISGRIPWSAVTELRANDRILVLMRDRMPVAWIPASAFSSAAQLDQVVVFMRARIEDAPSGRSVH